jgi:hypothetical protein
MPDTERPGTSTTTWTSTTTGPSTSAGTPPGATAVRRLQRGVRTTGPTEPVLDPSISPEDREVLLGLSELLWTAGEVGPVRPTMQAKGADDHLKAIGLLAVPTVGLSVIGLLLKSGADRSGGFVSFLYQVTEGCVFLVAGVMVLCALGLCVAMMHNRRGSQPQDYAMALAASLQGRYILPDIDLDDQSRALYLRARAACARITGSHAYVQGLLDTNAHRAVLPRLLWDLATELVEFTNQSAIIAESFQAGPRESGTQAGRARALAEAMSAAERRVVALEAHAGRVEALEPLCQELSAAREVAADRPTVEMALLSTLGQFADQEKSWLSDARSDALTASRAKVDSEARILTDDARRLRDLVFSGESGRAAFAPESPAQP